MKSIVSHVEYTLQDVQRKLDNAKNKLDENFMVNFQWGYCEELYIQMGIKNKLNHFLSFIEQQPERAVEWLEHNINDITERTLKGSFLGNSSSHYSNLAHTYDKEIDCSVLPIWKSVLRMIHKDNTPIK